MIDNRPDRYQVVGIHSNHPGSITLETNGVIGESLIAQNRLSGSTVAVQTEGSFASVSFAHLIELAGIDESIIDFFVVSDDRSLPLIVTMDNLAAFHLQQGKKHHTLIPYATYKRRALAMRYERFQARNYKSTIDQSARVQNSRQRNGRRPVWLLGEYPDRADDNAFLMFEWLRKNRPRDVDAYYVIRKSSPHWKKVSDLGNVIEFRSKRHAKLAAQTECVLSSHDSEYVLPTRDPEILQRYTAMRVFLGHGITAIKNVTAKYGAQGDWLVPHLMFVGSAKEKEILVRELGHVPDSIVPAGLPRFDTLLDSPEGPDPTKLLIFPTWRDWLVRNSTDATSEFVQGWRDLLDNPEFTRLCEAHGLRPQVLLHENLRRLSDLFGEMGVEVLNPYPDGIQQHLRMCRALITDYSSVAFDVSFLGRPVVFYQFDSKRFFRHRPYVNVNAELPGSVVGTATETIAALGQLAHNDWEPNEQMAGRSRPWLDHRDTQSRRRIFDEIRRRLNETAEIHGHN